MRAPASQSHTSLRCRLLAAVLLVVSLCGLSLARPVGKDHARQAADGWLRYQTAPMHRAISSVVETVQTMEEDGQSLCYIVHLQPEGFVVLSSDTDIEPVIAFSSTGCFYADERSPLTVLLKKDMTGRLQAVRQPQRAGQNAPGKSGKWEALTHAGAAALDAETPTDADDALAVQASALSVSDVWVDPFMLTEWNQGNVDGSPCYNYYTPSNYVVGCVATAMAQVMRYHAYPTSGIGGHGFTIEVDGDSQTASTRGGNGSGGAYNWSQMPLIPQAGVTTTQRQAIGALCYDAGVVAEMSYTEAGSGASLYDADQGLTAIFQFSNSVYTQNFSSAGDDRLWDILNANLDARLPVILGIRRVGGGHAVVADGYGYTGETLYHHINMGWGGADNAWYQLPTIDTTSPNPTYTAIDDCIYNIYTSGTGEIISGRVTNMAGTPLEDVAVSTYDGATLVSTTTDPRGVFALTSLSPNKTYTITAFKSGENFLDQTVTTGHSVDMSVPGNRSGILFVSANTGPPTAYDMDVEVNAGESVLIHLQGLDDGLPDPNLFRCIITSLPSHGVLSEPNVGFIDTVPYELTASICDVNYLPCPYFGGQDAFTYKAHDGGTYPTGGVSKSATVTVHVNDQLYDEFGATSHSYLYGMMLNTQTYYDVRTQVIYLPSELGSAKRITDFSLRIGQSPGRPLNNWTLRMKHTDKTVFQAAPYELETVGWTTVYQANETMSPTGWINVHLDTPFDYNGTQKLMVDFSYNNSGLSSPYGGYYFEDVGQDRSYSVGSKTGLHGDPLTWSDYGGKVYSVDSRIPSFKMSGVAAIDPLVGDFDASCDVTMPDVAIFSQAWLTTQGQDGYNAACDLTTIKGAVDLEDLLIFMGQWLETYAY